jgi:hypothetical protein
VSLRIARAAVLATLAAGPAPADTIKTPACQQGLAMANGLIVGIAAREKKFAPGDLTTNCRLLQQNLADLIKAREPMARCLTGHDLAENVDRIDGSIDDVRAVLADKCQK